MLELIVSVCLIGEPQSCRDVTLTMAEGQATPFQCMMYGQIEIANWLEAHPKWQLSRWTCGRAGQLAKI